MPMHAPSVVTGCIVIRNVANAAHESNPASAARSFMSHQSAAMTFHTHNRSTLRQAGLPDRRLRHRSIRLAHGFLPAPDP